MGIHRNYCTANTHEINWPNHHNMTKKSRIIPYRIGPMEILIGVQGLSGIAEMEVGDFDDEEPLPWRGSLSSKNSL